ncbi:hypothetical protein B0H19DRAFT_1081372 [Mycena capillaripes]|nr:hypothetical protein B0H19DRAFT_1081185 [Mycena capillaripes]KAJ6533210.1 hypothetical protein B0H19DRAFT_1081372 [Mycena capillaripes]
MVCALGVDTKSNRFEPKSNLSHPEIPQCLKNWERNSVARFKAFGSAFGRGSNLNPSIFLPRSKIVKFCAKNSSIYRVSNLNGKLQYVLSSRVASRNVLILEAGTQVLQKSLEGVKAMVSDSQPTYCIQGDNYFNKKVTQTVSAGSRLEDNNGPNALNSMTLQRKQKISAAKHTYSFEGSTLNGRHDWNVKNGSGRWRNVYDGPTVRYDGGGQETRRCYKSLAPIQHCKFGGGTRPEKPAFALLQA